MTAGGTEAILSMAIPAMKMGLSAAQQSNEQTARDADSRSKIEQIQQAQKLDARRRREQLRHALAARRARFGAQGISSSGSAEAVLAGLATEAERQDAEERALANARISRINDQSSYARRRSLLDSYGSLSQMAVGLAQRQPSRTSLIGF
jgi:hypothetical protein